MSTNAATEQLRARLARLDAHTAAALAKFDAEIAHLDALAERLRDDEPEAPAGGAA